MSITTYGLGLRQTVLGAIVAYGFGILVLPPLDLTGVVNYIIQEEIRICMIFEEERICPIELDNRIDTIKYEDRVFIIPVKGEN